MHSNAKNADEAEQVTYANTEVPISVEYSDDPPDGMTEGSVSSGLLKDPSTFDNSISETKPTEKVEDNLAPVIETIRSKKLKASDIRHIEKVEETLAHNVPTPWTDEEFQAVSLQNNTRVIARMDNCQSVCRQS